jgi:outer membrane protein
VLTLTDALDITRKNQPDLRRARAATAVALADSQAALAPLLPQLMGTASYQRTTSNFVPRPGAIPSASQAANRPPPSFSDTFNFYNFGLTATQLIYDFGASHVGYRASKESAKAQEEDGRAVERDVVLLVRTAFFQARALKELVSVEQENLANQERHLAQSEAFVQVGTRPDIDLAQGRTGVANARVRLIQAENAYAIGKASLSQAMGVDSASDFEVAEETLAAVPGEEGSREELLSAAVGARPELAALERRVRAQRMFLRAEKGSYAPILSASSSITAGGTELSSLVGNWNAGVLLTWPLFQGGASRAAVAAARANEQITLADQDSARQAVRFEVEQARLGVRAAKAVQGAADEAVASAREQLKLAEGRYAEGVGNVIELGDAQLAMTNAEAQRVQSDYGLSIARALLLKALGRTE